MTGRHDNRGFTLVELMTSIAITAIASVAVSSILVAGIRYSGLIYRQTRLQQELTAFDRMLELAIEDAEVSGYYQQGSEDTPEPLGSAQSPEKLWLFFKNKDEHIYHVFYFKNDGNVGHGLLDAVPDVNTLPESDLTPLSEHVQDLKVEYDASTKAFFIDITFQDLQITENMKGYWVL